VTVRRSAATAVIVGLLVGLVGCGGGGGGSGSVPTSTTARASRSPLDQAALVTAAADAKGEVPRCIRLWNSRSFAAPGERRQIGAQRAHATAGPFKVLVTRSPEGDCLVVLPDTPGGIDTYALEGGVWRDYILGGHRDARKRSTFEEELEPIAEAGPNAVLAADGRITLLPHERRRRPPGRRAEVEGFSEGGRQVCGTTPDTPAGPDSPAQEAVEGISCARGLAIFKEWQNAYGGAPGKTTRSGFLCREPVPTIERCTKGPQAVELSYGV
jgi:hypothetical protein